MVWKTVNETEAQAVTASRGVTLTAGTDDAAITAFQTAGGASVSVTLTTGIPYTPAIRITKTRADGVQLVGDWCDGATFVNPDMTFESDFGAYTNDAPTKVTRDTTIKRSGTYSCKFLGNGSGTGGWPQLSRAITFPSTGKTKFIRHFRYEGSPTGQFVIFGIAADVAVSGWRFYVAFVAGTGIQINNGSTITVLGMTPFSAAAWFKVVVDVNWSTKGIDTRIYTDAGVLVYAGSHTPSGAISGSLGMIIGRDTSNGSSYYIDDSCDGGL
jgi:hypothetical protein